MRESRSSRSHSLSQITEWVSLFGYTAEWRVLLFVSDCLCQRDGQLLISACTQILPTIYPSIHVLLPASVAPSSPFYPSPNLPLRARLHFKAGFLAPTPPPLSWLLIQPWARQKTEFPTHTPHEQIRCLLKCQIYEVAHRLIYHSTKYHLRIISTLSSVCLFLCLHEWFGNANYLSRPFWMLGNAYSDKDMLLVRS